MALGVHADLEFHVLDQRLQNAIPVLSEGRHAVPRHGDLPVFILQGLRQVADLDLVEFDLFVFFLLNGLHLGQLLEVGVVDLHLAGGSCSTPRLLRLFSRLLSNTHQEVSV
eukprot:CAMPEP_0170465184 /NCGR_PEP_ID=MMETSP0123-20130129/9620_1 /TAXON_ID=182087 /ORGANISM="Favella ehrenbergii, Strain Fehren 1" /LENGTH=110 /DNA_ID=CAMNT_0010731011 /DNA_START=465 /DNA_END=794 /DNA_ORIENTATION=-